MKFSVLQFFSWPGRRVPLTAVYERALDRIRIMDSSGFDAVWLAEHHFSTYSVCPSVHVMAMHTADITKNLRIGTGVSLAAFYHPLRLAEEVGLLDQLSGGRINWGAGRGFDPKEMEIFGVNSAESRARFQENVDVVLHAWKNDRFSYHGEFNTFEDVEVLPKPLQDPIPFWIASSSPDAIRYSAAKGFAILMTPHDSHETVSRNYALYRRELAEHSKKNSQDTPMARLIAIGRTDEEGEEIARNGSRWMMSSYFKQRNTDPDAKIQTPEERLEDYVQHTVIHGSAERVADTLNELKETIPLNYLLAAPLSHRSFISLVEDVMPRVI